MPAFARTIGIDYSGAETPTASLKGLRIYMAEGDRPPEEVFPPPSPRKYWTRKGIAHWLVERLAEDVATQVGTSAHPIAAKSAIWLCGPDLQNMAVTHRPAPRFVLAHRIIRCSDWRCS
jgi:hypothetical protein|tara:strand:- start:1517 stop:1873 length:357 start_codon:yes stop_codon:yes gene_type:complete